MTLQWLLAATVKAASGQQYPSHWQFWEIGVIPVELNKRDRRMKIAEQVTFGGSGLNRAAELRSDPAKIQKLMMASNARAMGLWQGKPLFANDEVDRIAWLPLDGPISKFSEEAPIFLGLDGDAPLFCFRIDNWSPDESPDSIGSFFDPSLQAFPNTDDECVFGDCVREGL